MFVRKGTVRKARGGSNRRSIRRPRRDSNGTAGPSKKAVIPDDPSSSSTSRWATPSEEPDITRSASTCSLPCEENIKESLPMTPVHCYTSDHPPVSPRVSPCTDSLRYQDEIVKPSPSRSQATTVVVS